MEIFFKARPLNAKGGHVPGYYFSLTRNKFEKINGKALSRIEDRSFFKKENKKFKKIRTKKEYKTLIKEEFGRDDRSLRRLGLKEVEGFALNSVVILSIPHDFVHKHAKVEKGKIVFDVLNNKFCFVPNAVYRKEKMSKGNGYMIEKISEGQWKVIQKPDKKKFPRVLGEIEMQEINDEVSESLYLWKSRLKYNTKCMRCKLTCKQPRIMDLYCCGNYEPIKLRKKRSTKK